MHLVVVLTLAVASHGAVEPREITGTRLREAVEGYWIGQLAGNYLGLPFENLYLDEPLPMLVDRYYTFRDAEPLGLKIHLDDRRGYLPVIADALGGAWSDDDSDIEFVYLYAVEQHGLQLTYAQLADAWRGHINRFIWGGNRAARDLMEQGLLPPATGSREHNPGWYRISSQLTTEIWGVFHPGQTARGGERAQWAARVATDGWATHPDRFFGTVFSAAYFERDARRLVELGRRALPEGSPFRTGIEELQRWRADQIDWREARARLHARYFAEVDGFRVPDPVAGSIINGLCAVLALLYGDNDWLRTVALAISAGYDCDNQAATCGALLGMTQGAAAIPRHITHELPSRGRWEQPFNDTYINYSRDALPAYHRNRDIIDRIQAIAVQAILQNGGRRLQSPAGPSYQVMTDL